MALDKTIAELVRAWAEGARFIERERAEHLAHMSSQEAWRTFDHLYAFWHVTGRCSGGDWAAIEAARIQDAIALRRALARLARCKGLPVDGDQPGS